MISRLQVDEHEPFAVAARAARGGGLGERVDVEARERRAEREAKVALRAPLLKPREEVVAQRALVRHDRIRRVVQAAVDLVEAALRVARLLRQRVVVLLDPHREPARAVHRGERAVRERRAREPPVPHERPARGRDRRALRLGRVVVDARGGRDARAGERDDARARRAHHAGERAHLCAQHGGVVGVLVRLDEHVAVVARGDVEVGHLGGQRPVRAAAGAVPLSCHEFDCIDILRDRGSSPETFSALSGRKGPRDIDRGRSR